MSSRLMPQIWHITLAMGIFCQVVNTSAAELTSALTTIGGAGGATIELANGDYGQFDFSTAYTSTVTLKAANRYQAVFAKITGSGASNMVFNGIKSVLPDPGVAQNPAETSDVMTLDNVTDVKIINCEVTAAARLRSGRCIRSENPTRLTIQNCLLHDTGRGGIRLEGTIRDCTIAGNEMYGYVTTAIGTALWSNSVGLKILRNEIYDIMERPEDPDWTSGTNADWAAAHLSFISLRDATNVQVEDNVGYNLRSAWFQLYGGESGRVYEYGNISYKRNILYNLTQGNYALYMQTTDTTKIGPFMVENNTIISCQEPTWVEGTSTLKSRFAANKISFGANGPGDTLRNNLVVGEGELGTYSEGNAVFSVSGDVDTGSGNTILSVASGADPYWVDTQFAAGQVYLGVHDKTQTRAGLSCAPAIGSTLATAGVGGTHVGAVAPA